MRGMSTASGRLLLALFLAVVAADLTRAQSQKVSLEGYPVVGTPAFVKVVSTGAEPRTRLRYKISAGQNFVLGMSITMGMTMNMEGMTMPAMDMPIMKMTATMNVKDVAANGDISYDIAFTEMTAEALPGMDPNLAAMVQGAASGITALKGSAVVSDRGLYKSGSFDLNKLSDPNLRQTLSSVASNLESLSMPMPEEPVGAGARWEVRQAMNSAGVSTFQRFDVELASVDGASATFRVKFDQTAPPQNVSNPSLPAGATVDVEKMTGSGSGSLTLRFDSLVPTSEMSSTTSMSMVVNVAGQSQKMGVDTKVKISTTAKKN